MSKYLKSILLISVVPLDVNGISSVITNIVNSLKNENVKIGIASYEINEVVEDKILQLKPDCELYRIGKRRTSLSYIKIIASIIKKNKYDIVHIHGNSCSMIIELLAAYFGKAKIRITHSHNTTCSHPIIDKLLRPVFYRLLTDRVACGFEAGRWLYGKKDFKILNNAIDTELFRFSSENRKRTRSVLGLNNETVLLGHVGKFNAQKNHKRLLEIVVSLLKENYKLLLLGTGPLWDEVKKQAVDLGIIDNVIFAGDVDNVYSYLSAIDIILMPSIFEGLPLSVVEEQANGLNCILSDSITKDVDLTGNVRFLDNQDLKGWVETVYSFSKYQDRTLNSDIAIKNIIKSGFDISSLSKRVKELYKL